jgi:hypothetical protein
MRSLLDGDIKPARYGKLNDPEVIGLSEKVKIAFVDRANPLFANATVRCKDGAQYVVQGEDHVFAPLDTEAQLRAYAEHFLGVEKIGRFVDLVGKMKRPDDLSELFGCLTPRTPENS